MFKSYQFIHENESKMFENYFHQFVGFVELQNILLNMLLFNPFRKKKNFRTFFLSP